MATPIREMERENLLDYLEVCLDFIDRSRKERSILVHCFAGVSRSAAIVTTYLMRSEQLSQEVSLLTEVLATAFLKDPTNLFASGPYGLIFASFVPFYFDIPVSTRFGVSGVHFSDKTFIYLAGLQLFLSALRRSIVPGVCGIIAGSLYRLNVFGIRKMKRAYPGFNGLRPELCQTGIGAG